MTPMPKNTPLRIFVAAVGIVGAVSLALALAGSRMPAMSLSELAVTCLLCAFLFVGELMPIRIRRGDAFEAYTFSGTAAIALVVTGPLWIALATQLAASTIDEARRRQPWFKVVFNHAQYVLALCAARVVYAIATGDPVTAYQPTFTPGRLVAALAAAAVFFVVNVVLIATVVSIAQGERLVSELVVYARDELPMATTLLAAGPIILVALQFSWLAAPICLLPALAVRRGAKTAADREFQAMHDPLTGLPNRSLLLQRATKALRTRVAGENLVLLLIDLDHFKEINDTLGHPVGDELLKQAASRLAAGVRPTDTAARLGGDEFAVLCPGVSDLDDAHELAERVLKALSEPFALEGIDLHVEASIGIAACPVHADNVDQLLQRADVALYQAKAAGRHVVRTYDSSADSNSIERLALMEQLRSGMDEQLVVHYQPKCRMSDGAIVGVEALVRWQHPQLGLLMPARFLPSAENSGLIVPLTRVVLNEALGQIRRWRDEGLELSVAVNISPRHLSQADLPQLVMDLLAEHNLPGHLLMLEVTESSIMSDPVRARAVLAKLRAMGVGVSIDDFGTGHSSLAYLRDLCATEVKIDRTFIATITEGDRHVALVRAAVQLGHSMGLTVVAEGVEQPDAVPILAGTGCDLLQGYLILPPVSADELAAWSQRPQVWTRALSTPAPRAPMADEMVVPR